jgi:hypothetical protein
VASEADTVAAKLTVFVATNECKTPACTDCWFARYCHMPAKSKKQQMAAGAALSAKRGRRPMKSLKGASRGMAASMSESQLRDIAKTKRKRLPRRAKSEAGKR